MVRTVTLRTATPADLAAVDDLLARSYPRLLAADYSPSVRVLALPLIARANPRLLGSGRYFLAEGAGGRVIGAGGWSLRGGGRAEVRHVATDPDHVRRGIGRALLERVFEEVRADGAGWLDCMATRTAVPFYRALGFDVLGPVEVPLAPGIVFPAVRMARRM